MDIQTIKIDLIHWLTGVDDMLTLKKVLALKQLQESELSDAHKALLEERMASYESDPKNVLDWEIVMKELEKDF
jgi:putative addiction module component (TIGR02574 family)